MEIKVVENQLFVNGTEVGWIKLEAHGAHVVIESLNLYPSFKGQGIGAAVIDWLKIQYKVISGCSSPLALNFWKKVGGEFEYQVEAEDVIRLLDMGEYPPFIIQR